MLAMATVIASAALPAATAQAEPMITPTSSAGAGERPGPDLLYAPEPAAPQLSNSGIWSAQPILLSGASAYRGGEYLYQDYLYDDHGAQQAADTSDRRQNNQFSETAGTYTYPSSPTYTASSKYLENAADLVEVRIKPLTDSTAVRVTMNTMTDPKLIGISIALGGTAGVSHPFPFGANTQAPADWFVTVHADHGQMVASLNDAVSGSPVLGPVIPASVDLARRQIDVRIPHTAWNPAQSVARVALAAGLWDSSVGRYLIPQASSSPTSPGGAGSASAPSAFFNVAFRPHEGVPHNGLAGISEGLTSPAFWRDRDQGAALATGDISQFFASVEFAKLAASVNDDSGVPTSGAFDRIYASHFETAQGVNYASSCYSKDFLCQYQGQLQPYAIYVPSSAPPSTGYGTTLLLHANAANYNEFLASRQQTQFGNRGTGSVVITPQARDPGSDYTGYAAADVFEAWTDAGRHYHLDPSWNAITGYSLGSLGTFKLSEQYPDLFAKALAVVGTRDPGLGQKAELASLRNIPTMIWDVGPVDELNPTPQETVLDLDRLGYRYAYLTFPGEHLTPAYNDNYAEAVPFLADTRLQPNPPHVSYVYAQNTDDGLDRPYGDYPKLGLTSDHAYWLSGLKLRQIFAPCAGYDVTSCGAVGTIDATSDGFGLADPVSSGTQHTTGVQGPGAIFPTLPYVELYQTWADPVHTSAADRLHINLTNVSAVTVDVRRAAVDCAVALDVTTDGPAQVTLAGCNRTAAFGTPIITSAAGGGGGLPNTATRAPLPRPIALLLVLLSGMVLYLTLRRGKAREGRTGPRPV